MVISPTTEKMKAVRKKTVEKGLVLARAFIFEKLTSIRIKKTTIQRFAFTGVIERSDWRFEEEFRDI